MPLREDGAHLIGFPGCCPNDYAMYMMERLCTHPKFGAVLLVSLGCESMDRHRLRRTIEASGQPVELLMIQGTGGTRASIAQGRAWVAARGAGLDAAPPVRSGFPNISDLEGRAEVGHEIASLVLGRTAGGRTRSEELGHQEFILTYKSCEPAGPGCLPAAA